MQPERHVPARMGDVGGHHGLAARHGLYLHDAESLRLLHAAQAEDVAGPVIGGKLPVGDPAEQPHLSSTPRVSISA